MPDTHLNKFNIYFLSIRVTSPHNTKVTQQIVDELCRQGGFTKTAVQRKSTNVVYVHVLIAMNVSRGSRRCPYSPYSRDWKFMGGSRSLKNFKGNV